MNDNFNLLQVSIKNKFASSDCLTIFIYDTSTSERVLVYQNTFYISPQSNQIILIPLIIANYEDFILLSNFQVAYTTQTVCTKVSFSLLYDIPELPR